MNDLFVISAVGKDEPGLVFSMARLLSKLGINIVDVDAKSVRGHFVMFLVVDMVHASCSVAEMHRALDDVRSKFNLGVQAEKYEAGRRKTDKRMMILTIMGADRVGIVASYSGLLYDNSVNIEKIKMIARGDYIAMEIAVDTSDVADIQSFRKLLYAHSEKMGLDISLRDNDVFTKPKRVIIFDCDSTIIQQEVIDELAKVAGVEGSVKVLTERAMNGDMDFEQALKKRVALLKGLPAEKLKWLIHSINLTPGAEDLISTLRSMGYKIGVISGGFTFFTDYLKQKLNLDYVFANELVIEDGMVTGEIKGEIIDAERKGEILKEIAALEGVSVDQIVAVGDGSNDRFMLNNAGLAIAFNPKEILKDYSDGMITGENISGLLYFLGVPESLYEN